MNLEIKNKKTEKEKLLEQKYLYMLLTKQIEYRDIPLKFRKKLEKILKSNYIKK